MNLIIRKAKTEDCYAIAELSNQLGYKSDIDKIKNRLSNLFISKEHCVFVATEKDIVFGWVHGLYTQRVESDPFVEIGGLVVDENFRNKGTGKMLVEKVIEWSKTNDCYKIRVRCNSVRKDAHFFYEQLDFTLNKTQKVFDRNID